MLKSYAFSLFGFTRVFGGVGAALGVGIYVVVFGGLVSFLIVPFPSVTFGVITITTVEADPSKLV